MGPSNSGKQVVAAAASRCSTGRAEGLVAIRVSSQLGEQELAKKVAAGWPPLPGKQLAVHGGRLVLLAHPGEPFHVVTRQLAPGLWVYGEGGRLPVGSLGFGDPAAGAQVQLELGTMPLWLLRASVRVPTGLLAREIFDVALEEAEAAARAAGLLPFYL